MESNNNNSNIVDLRSMELKAINPRTMADLRHVPARGGRNLEVSPPEISLPTANEINLPIVNEINPPLANETHDEQNEEQNFTSESEHISGTNESKRPNLANNNEQISDNSASESEHISNINFKRRRFLGISLWSGGAFLLGLLCRSLGPVTKLFPDHNFKLNSELEPPRKTSLLQDEKAQFETGLSVADAGSSIQIGQPTASQSVSPSMSADKQASGKPKAEKETDFKNFKVIEKKDSMVFIDKKANEEILILDWGG